MNKIQSVASQTLHDTSLEEENARLRQRIADLEAQLVLLDKQGIRLHEHGETLRKRGHGVRLSSHDLEIALLGLLNIRDMWGYEVQTRFRRALAAFWSLPTTQVYPRLRTMEKEDLVQSKTVIQGDRPNKRVYSITNKGRTMLKEWLSQPIAWPVMRHEFLLRLFLYDNVAPEIRERKILAYREQARAHLEQLREVDRQLQPALQGPYAHTVAFQLQSLKHLIRIAETEIAGADSVLKWLNGETIPSAPRSETNGGVHPLDAWTG